MPENIVLFAIITFLHDLATVVWIGGLFSLTILVIPGIQTVIGKSSQTGEILNSIQRRFRWFVVASIIIIGITGILMSKRSLFMTGAFSFANLYAGILSVKHILVILMIAFTIFMNVLSKKVGKGSGRFLTVNLIFGVLILLLSGFNAAIATTTGPVGP